MTEQTFSCPYCRAPNAVPVAGDRCQFCGGELLLAPAELTVEYEEPVELDLTVLEPAFELPPEPLDEFEVFDLPEAVVSVVEPEPSFVPVVQPVRTVPVVRVTSNEFTSRPRIRIEPPMLIVRDDVPEVAEAKPRIVLALLVLLGVLLAFVLGLSVIVYAVWIGFKTVAKPQSKAQVTQPAEGVSHEDPRPQLVLPQEDPRPQPLPPRAEPRPQPTPPPVKGSTDATPKVEAKPFPNFVPAEIVSISAPALATEKLEIPLSDAVSYACSGGGGRFWILWFAKPKELKVFDVTQAKFVRTISLKSDRILFAAGMQYLIVFDNDNRTISRHFLDGLGKLPDVQYPFPGRAFNICMGSASDGPLFVTSGHNPAHGTVLASHFIDPRSMEIATEYGPQKWPAAQSNQTWHFRANPSGTLFAAWQTSVSQRLFACAISNGEVNSHSGDDTGISLPTDEQLIVGGGGFFNARGELTSTDPNAWSRHRIPAQTGRFYLLCPDTDRNRAIEEGRDPKGPVHLYLLGQDKVVCAIPKLIFPIVSDQWTSSDFNQDRRILFVPEAKLIAVLPMTNDRLILYRFDPLEAIENATKSDFIAVANRPRIAVPGQIYRHPLDVKATTPGQLKFERLSGPAGLSVTTDGRIVWEVPLDASGYYPVTLRISNEKTESSYTTQIPVKSNR